MEQVQVDMENPALDDGAQDEISISESLGVKPQAEQPVQEEQPKPQKQISSQKDFDTALWRAKDSLRKDPAYQLGEKLIAERMESENITRKEAAERIEKERVKQKAADFKDKPEEAMEYILRKIEQKNSEPTPREADTFSAAQEVLAAGDMSANGIRTLAEAVKTAMEDGTLPSDFDPKTEATQAFFDDWAEFGIKTAARILTRSRGSASKTDATKAQQRKDEPKPIRTTGESTGREPINVADLSDDEFLARRKQWMTAADRGQKVRI